MSEDKKSSTNSSEEESESFLGLLFKAAILAGIFFILNPSKADHLDSIRESTISRGGLLLGGLASLALDASMFRYDNYYVFSTMKSKNGGLQTFGMFGYVKVLDKDEGKD